MVGLSRTPAALERRHARAWLFLCAALALHVADEALTDFLSVYNPTAEALRRDWPWLPIPTFTFEIWLGGLILAVLLLAALTPVVKRGGRLAAVLSVAFGALMAGNGALHLAGSWWLGRWMPGATTSPLLLLAAGGLLHSVLKRSRSPELNSAPSDRSDPSD